MTTNTELANSALAMLGEMPISSITDVTSKVARTCNLFADSARTEVLRLTFQSEATALSAMDVLMIEATAVRMAARLAVPLLGSQEVQSKMEQLFTLRLQEAKVRALHSSALNGRILAMIGNDLAKSDLSTTMLTEFVTTYQAEATKEVLRLTFATDEATAYAAITDSLILEAIDTRHAAKIATALTLASAPALEQQFAIRLQEAKVRALHSSAINGQVLAMIGNDLAKADLSPSMLTLYSTTYQAEATKEVLRLTFATDEATAYGAITDSLLLEAIDSRHAAKIAGALTLASLPALEQVAAQRLQEAKVRALHSSALNGKILAMIGNDLAKCDLSTSMLTEFVTTYADEALEEVLRMSRWGCAIKRTSLTAGTAPTVGDYLYAYPLPATCLRLLEVNGEGTKNSSEYFEIENGSILCNDDTCWIRYVDKITLAACDPLLALAITTRHAAKIAAALALPSSSLLESLFQKRLAEARQHDAAENGSAEKPNWQRVFGRSRLLNVRGIRRNPLRIEDY